MGVLFGGIFRGSRVSTNGTSVDIFLAICTTCDNFDIGDYRVVKEVIEK